MTEEQQRIRSYLVAQGAKLSPAAGAFPSSSPDTGGRHGTNRGQ